LTRFSLPGGHPSKLAVLSSSHTADIRTNGGTRKKWDIRWELRHYELWVDCVLDWSAFIYIFLSSPLTSYDHAANAAGPGASRFSEVHGTTTGEEDEVTQGAAATAVAGAAAAGQPQAYKPPYYLRPWFIVTSLVVGALGLALLFIILYPVVKAIAQLVVDRSVLNIDVAMITTPQNNS